ncbi:FAD-dependent oxidoreductase [Microbacterium telephonicum]|uniref:Glycine/D-amino acid oxidase-like deaminating enzyme n=1 Tax=Microbacterium telephonicum TaxID=1714841 RepID=A0A498C678_9MICO|nr:FAD-dependent oxidoreductase [Microbacterium telephonicum]RLK47871.1 glycine/D-amino acid oxidase-like deaminating enzyme [Microbacterium telephonicum]
MPASRPPLWKLSAPPVETDPGLPAGTPDVVVVGAGLTGLVTALRLTRAGRRVAVVEAGTVGELASGGNTGKVSLLQGKVLGTLRRHHPASLVRAYVEANAEGAAWLRAFAEAEGVPITTRTAVSYAQTEAGMRHVEAEERAAAEAGLPVHRLVPDGSLPFPLVGGVALAGQSALDPMAVLRALARRLRAEGGTVHAGIRVTGVRTLPHPRLTTDAGPIEADSIVLATATPLLDRGLYFAKTRGLRSHAVAFELDEPAPEGMYLSVDGATRSLRAVTPDDGPGDVARLIVGGNGSPVGRAYSERAAVDDLVAWTRTHFPSARPVTAWSAQDYESHDLIPFIGVMPRTGGAVRFATGYGKWGLTLAPAAAARITAEITGVPWAERPDWMRTIARRMTVPADLGRGGVENVAVGWEAASGWVDAQRRPVPVPRPAEGEGVIAHRGLTPVGVSTVDGITRGVRAVCPHLGGVLRWNDAECTWDCPLHASRFRADGTRIEGPAVHDLETLPRTPD